MNTRMLNNTVSAVIGFIRRAFHHLTALFLLLYISTSANAQSAANYSFTTSNTASLTDMNGRITMLRQLNVEMGSNTLAVNVSALAGGTYMVKMISSNGEVSTGKLVKQ